MHCGTFCVERKGVLRANRLLPFVQKDGDVGVQEHHCGRTFLFVPKTYP